MSPTMIHSMGYQGQLSESFRRLRLLLKKDPPIPPPTKRVYGVRFGYMEKRGRRFFAVRASYGRTDVVLKRPLALTRRYMGNKGFGPKETYLPDEVALRILRAMARSNPQQQPALRRIQTAVLAGPSRRT